ncbi:pre-mRNA splicing regulator USH1G-like [Tachypleus tridentatus]|uniref:pre-mRNA splicing regulator USH1G-like n=1 Tax=Tachypleus tridentatus TaxID=6853 RepID=UPI003FD6257B
MSTADIKRFHRAAQDGCIDLLHQATRKDCNAPDEEGMTPTLWAAYHGHLNALRVLTGRGGNPDKCDYFGNTALHCAAAKGHINCVSFLVNFGANLWTLDNNYLSAKDVAANNNRKEILKYLDKVMDTQQKKSSKNIAKMKEKAKQDTEKRVKNLQKIQCRAIKTAEKSEKELERQQQKMFSTNILSDQSKSRPSFAGIGETLRKDSKLLYTTSPKYSDIVNINQAQSTLVLKRGQGAVSKKIQQRKAIQSDFKVREIESNGKQSVRSLSGLRRDSEVLYVPRYETQNNESAKQFPLLKNVFDGQKNFARSHSEPNIFQVGEFSQLGPSSIFERPGFGSMAFRGSLTGALLSLPDYEDNSYEDDKSKNNDLDHRNGSVNDSIGSAGSLARRHAPWDDEVILNNDDEVAHDSTPIILFLAAHGMTEYIPLFTKEKIDLESLILLTDSDLKDLGLPLGPRRKLRQALEQRKKALENPGEVTDTKL